MRAIRIAAKYRVKGWAGYLISLAEALGASIIYTIDLKLARVKYISVVPISRGALRRYHQWLKSKLGRTT